MIAKHRVLLPAIMAMAMVAATSCSKKEEQPVETDASANKPAAVVNTPLIDQTIERAPMPEPEIEVPERVTRLMSSPIEEADKGQVSKTKLNATSPDAFVQSLQTIERESSKENVDDFRAALTIMQLQTQQRVQQLASTAVTPPQFTDQQLMDLAFSDINGMTLDQIVAHAKKIAPEVVPNQ